MRQDLFDPSNHDKLEENYNIFQKEFIIFLPKIFLIVSVLFLKIVYYNSLSVHMFVHRILLLFMAY